MVEEIRDILLGPTSVSVSMSLSADPLAPQIFMAKRSVGTLTQTTCKYLRFPAEDTNPEILLSLSIFAILVIDFGVP